MPKEFFSLEWFPLSPSFWVPKISWHFRGCKCENRLNQLPLCWPARVLHPNYMATLAISMRKGQVTCSVQQGSNQDESQCSVQQSEDSAVIFPSIPKKDKECRKEHLDVWLSHLRATCFLKLIQLTSKQQFSVQKKACSQKDSDLVMWKEKQRIWSSSTDPRIHCWFSKMSFSV